jgi:hypothetical protein
VPVPIRAHPRYAHEAEVRLVAPGVSVMGRTTNLSRGGLCATLVEAVPMGTQLDAEVSLVFADAQSEPLVLPARVVWCTQVDAGYQIGISFLPLDAEHADNLGLFLRYLDEGLPPERRTRNIALDDRFR